jgi:hypothetical protein
MQVLQRSYNVTPLSVGYRRDGTPIVVSRFLHSVIIVWLDPVLVKGKPILYSAKGMNTVVSDQNANVFIEEIETLSADETFWLHGVYLPLLRRSLTKDYDMSDLSGYSDRIVRGKTSSEHTFDISNCKCFIVIGKTPVQPRTLLKDINSILTPELRASDRLILDELDEILRLASRICRRQQILTKDVKKVEAEVEEIKGTVDNIDNKVSKILDEVSVRRVAYGEYEVIFPTPIGAIYKIHIPAGELTTDDFLRISNMVNQAVEKAKQKSVKLYNELRTKKRKITQKILAKLTELLGQEKTQKIL